MSWKIALDALKVLGPIVIGLPIEKILDLIGKSQISKDGAHEERIDALEASLGEVEAAIVELTKAVSEREEKIRILLIELAKQQRTLCVFTYINLAMSVAIIAFLAWTYLVK